VSPVSRRVVLAGGGTALLAAQLGPALGQRNAGPAQVPVDELMKSDLPEIVIGKADAPVTIVEYASMTCGHCAAFHNNVLPKLKEKYIDTGKARLVFRDFPLDNIAAAVSMLARCVGGDGSQAFIGEMFKRQQAWAFAPGNPVPRLFEMARQAGFTQATFDKCLTDQKLLEQIEAGRKRASEKFGVNATPTFFINGKRLGGVTLADFEKAIDPLLKG
jgi:protein-disulfide isomerase